MYHIVYLTTNIINSKIYVGVRSTYNLDDGYLGSGIKLKLAIKKYGKQYFKRQIIYFCLNREDALQIESQIVTESFIKLPNNYNCCVGGLGGSGLSMKGIPKTEEHKQKIGDAHRGTLKPWSVHCFDEYNKNAKGRQKTEEHKQKIGDAHRGKIVSDITKEKLKEKRKNQIITEETKLKLSELHKGDKNHFYGKNHNDETKQKMKDAWVRRKQAKYNIEE